MFRTLTRWFSTEETKQLAHDIDKLKDLILTYGHKLEGLDLRVERHLNKLQMREARSARGREDSMMLSPEEQEILADIRRKSGNGNGGDDWMNNPPDFTR